MESPDYKEKLLEECKKRDVNAIIRFVSGLIKNPKFPPLYRRLVKEGKITSATIKIEDVAQALMDEVKEGTQQGEERIVEDNYFDIGEQLKKRFGDEVSEIYINTKIPGEFLTEIRASHNRGDTTTLSEDLVNRYKNELVRIEEGRRAIVEVLQKYSHFTITNAKALSSILDKLHSKLRASYSYVSLKPYFADIYAAAGTTDQAPKDKGSEAGEEAAIASIFSEYINTGIEPELIDQVRFRIAVNKLFQQLQKKKTLPHKEHQQFWSLISKIFNYHGATDLPEKARNFLEDLLEQVNEDKIVILKRLAQTFVDEYQSAEEQMKIRHNMITKELAYTQEYLKQLTVQTHEEEPDEEKIRIAQEKIVGLDGIFVIPPSLQESAIKKPFSELERAALGIATAITSSQITDWIKIYSIVFSNSEFLAYTQTEVDFSITRKYISDLTTYHLILNIASLKTVVDKSMRVSDDEKASHFKRFNEALKLKLQGLMSTKKKQVTSLKEMIEELRFLDNEATQFVIAETFKGFQAIVDAFNSTANEVFVRDREALLKESKELYTQICDQCMKNFVKRPMKIVIQKAPEAEPEKKKSWLGKLFS